MINKLLVVSGIVILYSGVIHAVVPVQAGGKDVVLDMSEIPYTVGTEVNHQFSIDQFLRVLELIDLSTPLVSVEADGLAQAFSRADTAIQTAEEAGDFRQAQEYRTVIQKAVAEHMKRPGAMEAAISDNIDAYSRYLTETAIAKVK